ncbi:MAG TPA: 8-amino-7-oxononanoate synthase, partial [Rhodanobacteraceae bacterium]|nr:8-amino-7-oxononanoate synthase [Rhodanobacteraceae bacterium]
DLLESLTARVAERERTRLLRRARTLDAARGVHITIDGRDRTNFCSNDYLGLAQDPRITRALREAANECGVGSTAAHLVCGHRREHARLEEALCEWTGREAAILFSSGWLANLGAMQALLDRDAVCVQDKLNHASLLDAVKLAGAALKRYPHRDAAGAERQLAAAGEHRALLATDGVFSMDGDVAPLRELATLCKRDGAALMVDDAHGLGVLGACGAGSADEAGLQQDDVPVLMATLGKALGCMGAFVAGSRPLVEGLTQFARTFVYTTAMPPALAAATCEAVHIARTEDWRREKLHALIARFRSGAMQLGLPLADSTTAIQPIVLGDAARTVAASQSLEDRGHLVTAIRPPTVPAGSARLRVTLSAAHEEQDVDRLLDALSSVDSRHSGTVRGPNAVSSRNPN